MEYLGPPQLYLLRQTCRMFWRLFTDRKFAYLDKELVWLPTNLKPNERIPVDVRGSMIEFNQINGSPEWRQAARLQDCRANQDSILRHRCLPNDYIQDALGRQSCAMGVTRNIHWRAFPRPRQSQLDQGVWLGRGNYKSARIAICRYWTKICRHARQTTGCHGRLCRLVPSAYSD